MRGGSDTRADFIVYTCFAAFLPVSIHEKVFVQPKKTILIDGMTYVT